MRNLLLGAAMSLAVVGGAAAADLPVYSKAPAWSWTGCYVGVQAGGGAISDSWTFASRGIGALGGGQVGCNYQTGHLVFGIEADGWASGINAKAHSGDSSFDSLIQTSNRWDFDVALRAGIAMDRALIYGKAGAVWARYDMSRLDSILPCCTEALSGSTTLSGILIGLGLEYALTSNWTTKLEYNFLGFAAKDVTITCVPNCGLPAITSVAADKHVIKVGINYKLY